MGVVFVMHQNQPLDEWTARMRGGEIPQNLIVELAGQVDCAIVTRNGVRVGLTDRLLALATRLPSVCWAQARMVRRGASVDDSFFVIDPPTGLLVALLCPRNRVAVQIIDPSSRPTRAMLRLLGWLRRAPDGFTATPEFLDPIRRMARRGGLRSAALLDLHVDEQYFAPSRSPRKPRLIATAGAERRDYATLVEAIEGLDVTVVAACAVSPDAGPKSARYPSRVPPNLRFADLSMEELRDLYCEASLVVIPMLRNPLGAGGTVAGEARACGTPPIVSHTSYLSGLAEKGLAVGVAPGDPADLRRAIVAMLDDAPGRAELAQRSRRALLDINATPAVLATWHRYLRATFGVADVGATRPRAEVSGTG